MQTEVKHDMYLAWRLSVRAVTSQHKLNTSQMKVLHNIRNFLSNITDSARYSLSVVINFLVKIVKIGSINIALAESKDFNS